MNTPIPPALRAGFARTLLAVITACCLVCLSGVVHPIAASAQTALEPKYSFDVPAGEAKPMLRQFAAQAKREIVFGVKEVGGIKTNAVKGEMTAQEAADQMLANTGLVAAKDAKTGAFAVRKETPAEAKNGSSRPEAGDRAAGDQVEGGIIKLDTFEVMGTKVLNMDKPRSRDDAQPYTVFDREVVERSGAGTIEDFFRQRLTMAVVGTTNSQTPGNLAGVRSGQINLRGLGSDQTLILIDGHRLPDFNSASGVSQPDISGIPLGAIERVEVLAATSSGIYGGSATGGVINIILRRDYVGAELKLSYANTFDTDSAKKTVSLSGGFNLEDGKTNVIYAASYSTANTLLARDRDFATRGAAAIMANNPATTTFFTANPPLGSTPNIRSTDGSNLMLKNGTALDSPFTSVPAGYAGTSDGGLALVGNAGKYNFALSPDASTNANAMMGGGAGIFTAPVTESLMTTVRRRFSARLQGFLELAASNSTGHLQSNNATNSYTIAAAAPNNPFQQAVRVTIPVLQADTDIVSMTKNRRVVAGAIVQLPGEWKAESDFTWLRTTYRVDGVGGTRSTATTAIGNGSVDVIRDLAAYPVDLSAHIGKSFIIDSPTSTLKDYALRANGPIGSLPAGTPELGLLAEYRNTEMSESTQRSTVTGLYTYFPMLSQDVASVYAELKVPLVAGKAADLKSNTLEMQLASRADWYDSRGGASAARIAIGNPAPAVARGRNQVSSVNPTVALRYQPISDVTLRVSYGTGFQPPSLTQLVAMTNTLAAGSYVDPKRGNSLGGSLTYYSGGNPALEPEKSESWSAGLILAPRALPGLRLSVDYTRIEKQDNIAGATSFAFQGLINAEAENPGRITRGPGLPGDLPGWAGPITALDFSLVNQARARLEAFDVQLEYRRETPLGAVTLSAMGTWTPRYQTQITATSAWVENVGMGRFNVLKFSGNAGATLARKQWSFSWFAYYFDSYLAATTQPVVANQGNQGRVKSQVFHDASFTYRLGSSRGTRSWARLLGNTEIQASIRNILNDTPAFDASVSGIYYSTFAEPQLARYTLSIKKSF